jgi:signal transduction histidine kinase
MKLGISAKVNLYVLGLFIAVAIGSAFLIVSATTHELQAQAEGELRKEVSTRLDNMDSFLSERLSDIKFLSENRAEILVGNHSAAEKLRYLHKIEEIFKVYFSISVYDSNGTRVIDTRGLGIGDNEKGAPYLREALRGNIYYDKDLRNSDDVGQIKSMHFSGPLTDESGKVIGAIVTRVPIQRIAGEINTNDNFEVELLSKEGLLIYSNKHAGIIESNEVEKYFRRIISDINSPQIIKLQSSGREIIGGSARERGFLEFAGNQWVLILSTDSESFFSVARETQSSAVYLVLLLASIAVVVAYIISSRLFSPITLLTDATSKIKSGDYSVRLKVDSMDEFESLANELNEMAMALSRLEQERTQLDKAKTEFMSITSHELRSPITPMKAQLQMLSEGYFDKLNEKQQESVEMILRNINRLDKIIMDFLEISRIEAARLKFNFSETDLGKLVRDLAVEMKGFLPEKKVRIVTEVGQLPLVEVDPDRVTQVLRNLLTNAIKFSPQGGKITVSVREVLSHIKFAVKDEGVGISKDRQGRIFEPFFQVENAFSRKFGGTGLGLAISKGIVEAQNGRIWFYSEPGKGTEFHFTLPLVPVRDVKPIKILLSRKERIEDSLRDIFSKYLGPMGREECEEILMVGASQRALSEFISKLRNDKVLKEDLLKKFEDEIKYAIAGYSKK